MRSGAGCVIVGAGLAGAAAAWTLESHGIRARVVEGSMAVGGHARSEWFRGIPYEPQGPHIFHTSDSRVWDLVTRITPFAPYRHRVAIRVGEQLMDWPLQRDDLPRLPEWEVIRDELARRPTRPDLTSFETRCISMLGRTLYRLTILDYTRKQWMRDPAALSAALADSRIELRDDGYRDYFRDPYQGWPVHGYGALAEGMLAQSSVVLGASVNLLTLPEFASPGEPVILTCALDEFFGEPDSLEWRGVRLESSYYPDDMLRQPHMVVNEPSAAVPWTRTIETKWALPALHATPGTIVMREFPGAPVRHYPVPDVEGLNRERQTNFEQRAALFARNPLLLAGRLATYRYINMDTAISDGIAAAQKVVDLIRRE